MLQWLKNWTSEQKRKFADILSLWGNGSAAAGAADAFFGEGRILVDLFAGVVGIVLIAVCLWLTGKVGKE